MSLKETVKEFRRSFVPKGRTLTDEEFKYIKFRRTGPDELYRCSAIIGDDWPQSGFIYCGDVAEWIGTINDGNVCLCSRHAPPKRQRIDE